MKEMAAMQSGMSFYGELPDSYNLIVNVEHPLIAKIKENALKDLSADVQPIDDEIIAKNGEIEGIRNSVKENEQLSDEQHKEIDNIEAQVKADREKLEKLISDYASKQPLVGQLIDLALLSNGLLRGEDLSKFISRSISLL